MNHTFINAFLLFGLVSAMLTFAWVRVRYWKQAYLDATKQTVSLLDGYTATRRAEEDKLAAVHPDWQKVVGNPDFRTWAQTQGPPIRRVVAENAIEIIDGEACAEVVTAYKRR